MFSNLSALIELPLQGSWLKVYCIPLKEKAHFSWETVEIDVSRTWLLSFWSQGTSCFNNSVCEGPNRWDHSIKIIRRFVFFPGLRTGQIGLKTVKTVGTIVISLNRSYIMCSNPWRPYFSFHCAVLTVLTRGGKSMGSNFVKRILLSAQIVI